MAWTANTDTFAMSEYPECPWREPAAIDGALYAVSENGIVAMDGETDEGVPFNSGIEWGATDFEDERLKRPRDVFVGYQSPDVFYFLVEAGNDPDSLAPWEYELPERIADTPEPNRFKVGRGIRARYFRLSFESAAGVPFTLYSVSLTIDVTSRRI